ncbi:adenylate kinase family protein [Candidatus Woesearchaeota archaeon]|nr:adenylate kinase family protein [Candidatus Woesearchaeota archaeon]
MIIIVTGTPGTGKTKIAKLIAKKFKCKYIDLYKIIKKYKLIEGYDKKRKTKIVDEKKLAKKVIEVIKNNKNLVIDGHLSHYIPRKYVDLCIVTKCNIKVLKRRLGKRNYSKEKIRENLDAEIFDVILNEAIEREHKVFIIDTTKKFKLLAKSAFSS